MDQSVNQEHWKPVLGYESFYEVSDQGRVRSLDREVPHRKSGFLRLRGRVLVENGSHAGGYRQVMLSNGGKLVARKIHRLVLESFVGPKPEGAEARHVDGNPANNRLTNLCWGTHAENEKDKRLHGTDPAGERHGGAKLTAQDVLAIRSDTRRQSVIAAEYGICQSRVSAIKRRRNWASVQ